MWRGRTAGWAAGSLAALRVSCEVREITVGIPEVKNGGYKVKSALFDARTQGPASGPEEVVANRTRTGHSMGQVAMCCSASRSQVPPAHPWPRATRVGSENMHVGCR